MSELTNGEICQLEQLRMKRFAGVWSGDLIDKDATRSLIRKGYAEGCAPSSLTRVYISKKGLDWWKSVKDKMDALNPEGPR